MAAQRQVLLPAERATPKERTENNMRMKEWNQEKRLIGQACKTLGHSEMTGKVVALAGRLRKATARYLAGQVPVTEAIKMLERADGSKKIRSKGACRRHIKILKEAGLVHVGHGWVRWVGVGNHLFLAPNESNLGQIDKEKIPAKRKPGRKKRIIQEPDVLLGFAVGEASASGAKKNSSENFLKNTNSSARRAAAVHAKRNPSGQFTANSAPRAPEAACAAVQTDPTPLSQCHDRRSGETAEVQEASPTEAVEAKQPPEAADAAIGVLKKMPKTAAASSIAAQFLAFGAAHPEAENERLAAEKQRLKQLAKRQQAKPQVPEIVVQPDALTASFVHELNGLYGIELNIFKLKKAGITDEVLNDAAYFTYDKHREKPFKSIEAAIVNAALQRKRGLWGPKP